MDIVYQFVFILHFYPLMKLCKSYFDFDHIGEKKQDKETEAQELRKERSRFIKLIAYTVSISLLWPMLPEILGSDPGLLRFFLTAEVENPPYILVSCNILCIDLLVMDGWFLVWLVKVTQDAFKETTLAEPVPHIQNEQEEQMQTEKLDHKNTTRMERAISGLELTEAEKRSLKWLCDCDWRTVENVVSVIEKARESAQVGDTTRKDLSTECGQHITPNETRR